MDRGDDRDLLSSGVFDGCCDHFCNKSLTATATEREANRGRGAIFFCYSDAFSLTGVMFGRDEDNSSVTGNLLRNRTSRTKFTAYNLK